MNLANGLFKTAFYPGLANVSVICFDQEIYLVLVTAIYE